MLLTDSQEELICQAGVLIKKAFPEENMQFNFNLNKKFDNVNFNIEGTWKLSGIINPKRT